jgi:serine/threonine-protein kinase RsbW
MTSTSAPPLGRERRSFPARMSMLHETRVFVEGFAARHGMDEADALRLELVIEELFSNTVTHGYGGDSDEAIEITLVVAYGRATVVYEDAAQPYDPLAKLAALRATLTAPLEQRPVGHLGVPLIAGLVERADYRRDGGRNRLELFLSRTG